MKRSALVFGENGLLGQALVDELLDKDYAVHAVDREECDIREPTTVERIITEAEPEIVFNAAAYTNVDGAESDHLQPYMTNVHGSHIVARAATKHGAKVVLYSTDFVFDGKLDRPYRELDWPTPLNAYGRTKADADRALRLHKGVLILRMGGLYGRGGRNFASKIIDLLRDGHPITADDQRRVAPTWVRDAARLSVAVAASDITGLYHLAPKGDTTWADFAQQIVRRLGLPDGKVQGVHTAALGLPAARPKHALLDSSALAMLGFELPRWEEGLDAYLKEETAA